MHQVVDDFLPKKDIETLKKTIMSDNFPWYYQPVVEGEDVLNRGNYAYFTHLLLNDGIQNSNILNTVLDSIKPHFEWKMIGRVKCNLYPNSENLIEHRDHVDAQWEHKGLIISLNTCDGATVLEDGSRIESVENRALFFDPSKPHHSTNCTNDKSRININVNYF
jgi:hypothetical protein